MKASEWLQRGKASEDPIDAFSNYWLAFNNLYFGCDGVNEREKIQQFLRHNVSNDAAEQLLSSYPPQIEYLLSQPVIDMRGNGRDTTPNIEAFKSAADSQRKLKELFMIIYQVRCNLMHGQKSPNRKRDVVLCQCAAPVVAGVIPHDA